MQKFCELFRSKRLLDFVLNAKLKKSPVTYSFVNFFWRPPRLKQFFHVQFILIQHKRFEYQRTYH